MFCYRIRRLRAHLMVRPRDGRVIKQRRGDGRRPLGRNGSCLPVDRARRQAGEARRILLQPLLPLLQRDGCGFLFDPLLVDELSNQVDLPAQFFIGHLLTSDHVREIVAGCDHRPGRNDQQN